MRRARSAAALLALGVVSVLVLSACGSSSEPGAAPTAEDATQQEGGIVTTAAFTEMPGFDPVRLSNLGLGVERAAQVMDTLLYRDERTDEVRAQLAEGIESEDAKVWTLHLREGLTFTDGTDLDADAVIFNLQRHIAPDSKSAAKSLLSGITSMEATDKYTVTIELAEPSGAFPLALTGTSSGGLIGSPAALADPDAFNENPVGAGPFVVDEWQRDTALRMSRNDDYWDRDNVHVEGLQYLVLPDLQGRVDALNTGSADIAFLQAASWSSIDANGQATVRPLDTGGQAVALNAATGPTADPRVREAMRLAIIPQNTANVIFQSTGFWDGDLTCIPFPRQSGACEESLDLSPDPERAAELVKEYLDEGGSPELELVHFSGHQDQAAYLQEEWRKLGLVVSLKGLETPALAEVQTSGAYGAFLGGTSSTGYPTVWNRYYSGGLNWGNVTIPELDEALFRARDEISLDDRNAAWREASQIVYDEGLVFWISPHTAAMTTRDVLHLGSEERPYEGSSMVYYNNAWLEQ